MRIYKQLTFCLLLLSLPASADEAEVWKCKIKETLGFKSSDGELRPTRFISEDHEYRILNLEALIEVVGKDQVVAWMRDEVLPFNAQGQYFFRSTSMSPKEKFGWNPLFGPVLRSQYRGDHAFFDPEERRFEVAPLMINGWFSGDDTDYVYEFAECVRYYD